MAPVSFESLGWFHAFWRVQWFAGLIPVLLLTPLLLAARREGRWPRRRALLFAAPFFAWGAPFLAIQMLAVWALQQHPLGIIVTADHIWCAPWTEGARWENIVSLETYDEKMGRGWKTLGVTLALNRSGDPRLRPRAFDSSALRWGIRFARGPVFGHGPLDLPCGTMELERDSQALIRLIQEIHFKLGPRVGAQFRPRNRCWVDWCLKNRGPDYACVANMPSDPSTKPCLAGVDY